MRQGITRQIVEHPRPIQQQGAGRLGYPLAAGTTATEPKSANGELAAVEPEAGHQLLHRLHQGGLTDAGPASYRLPGAGQTALNPNQQLLQFPLPTDKKRKGCVLGIPTEAAVVLGVLALLLAAFHGVRQGIKDVRQEIQGVRLEFKVDLQAVETRLRADNRAVEEKLDRVLETLRQPLTSGAWFPRRTTGQGR